MVRFHTSVIVALAGWGNPPLAGWFDEQLQSFQPAQHFQHPFVKFPGELHPEGVQHLSLDTLDIQKPPGVWRFRFMFWLQICL